jgi:hypothetical protein
LFGFFETGRGVVDTVVAFCALGVFAYFGSDLSGFRAGILFYSCIVIAYGIRTNIQRQLFEGSRRMFELADTTEKMPTMCPCGRQAEFNGRFVDGNFHVGEPVVWIDNDPDRVRYQSLCGQCYLEHSASSGAINEHQE